MPEKKYTLEIEVTEYVDHEEECTYLCHMNIVPPKDIPDDVDAISEYLDTIVTERYGFSDEGLLMNNVQWKVCHVELIGSDTPPDIAARRLGFVPLFDEVTRSSKESKENAI